jgi:hypothetical protein
MKLRLALIASILCTAPLLASAGPSVGISIGQNSSPKHTDIRTDFKTLQIGYAVSSRFNIQAGIEKLDAGTQSCAICTVGRIVTVPARAYTLSTQFALTDSKSFSPFLLAGVAVESFDLGYTTTDYTRREIGLGIAIRLAPQIHLSADLRLGVHDRVQSDQVVLQDSVPFTAAVSPYADGEEFRGARVGIVVGL